MKIKIHNHGFIYHTTCTHLNISSTKEHYLLMHFFFLMDVTPKEVKQCFRYTN